MKQSYKVGASPGLSGQQFRRTRIPVLLILSFLFLVQHLFAQAGTAPASSGTPEVRKSPVIALVLSGGSAFGMAHVGVIKVLEEAGIPVDMVMGTSMGSIVSGMYAAGYSPDAMEKIVTSLDWNAIFMDSKLSAGDRYDFRKRTGYVGRLGFDASGIVIGEGLFSGQNVLALFTELTMHALPTRNFDDLPVPYRAVAADIWNGEKIVFSSGSIAEAMRSSMSIPGVFRPYVVDGRHVVDGGIVDNLPVDIARGMGADIVIAVESRGAEPKGPEAFTSALSIAGQTFGIFIAQNMKPSRSMADILIVPDLSHYSTASYGEAAGIINQGESGARAMLPQVMALAERIAKDRPLVRPDQQPNRKAMRDLPKIASVRISGTDSARLPFVNAAFQKFAGTVADRAALRKAVDAVYATGDYDLVKLDFAPLESGEVNLLVHCTPTTRPSNAILVNYDLDGTVSTNSSIDSELSAGLLFRAVTTPQSAFFAKAALGSGFRGYAELFQPAGPFFLLPWARFNLDYDEWIIDEFKISTLYRAFGGGLWAGTALGRRAEFRAGVSYEWVRDASIDSKVNKRQAAVRAALWADTRNSTVFPDRGVSFLAYGLWSDGSVLGEIPFATFDLTFQAALPLGEKTSLGFSAFAGSDFAGIIPGVQPAPDSRYFVLPRRGLFYGLIPKDPYAQGDTVGAIGLELRRNLGRINPILGGDIFLVLNGSLGTADMYEDPTVDFFPLRWSVTAGAGVRVTNETGLFAGAGVVSVGNRLRPALTVSLGSFEDSLEDRR